MHNTDNKLNPSGGLPGPKNLGTNTGSLEQVVEFSFAEVRTEKGSGTGDKAREFLKVLVRSSKGHGSSDFLGVTPIQCLLSELQPPHL